MTPPIGAMRRHRGRQYNIFQEGNGYVGKIFDRYRQVDYQCKPLSSIESTVNLCRDIIEMLNKGQCVPGALADHVDEGKAIRLKEEKEYRAVKCAARNRK